MTEETETETETVDPFINAVGQADYLSAGYPGCTTTIAFNRYLACHIATELGMSSKIPGILIGECDDEDIKLLARAFSAYAARNRGNLYAGNIICDVLAKYAGNPVPQNVMDMLEMLEDYVTKVGDTEPL